MAGRSFLFRFLSPWITFLPPLIPASFLRAQMEQPSIFRCAFGYVVWLRGCSDKGLQVAVVCRLCFLLANCVIHGQNSVDGTQKRNPGKYGTCWGDRKTQGSDHRNDLSIHKHTAERAVGNQKKKTEDRRKKLIHPTGGRRKCKHDVPTHNPKHIKWKPLCEKTSQCSADRKRITGGIIDTERVVGEFQSRHSGQG